MTGRSLFQIVTHHWFGQPGKGQGPIPAADGGMSCLQQMHLYYHHVGSLAIVGVVGKSWILSYCIAVDTLVLKEN
jgi:hypothetical protein